MRRFQIQLDKSSTIAASSYLSRFIVVVCVCVCVCASALFSPFLSLSVCLIVAVYYYTKDVMRFSIRDINLLMTRSRVDNDDVNVCESVLMRRSRKEVILT